MGPLGALPKHAGESARGGEGGGVGWGGAGGGR